MKTYEEAANFMADGISPDELDRFSDLRDEIYQAPITMRFLEDCMGATSPLRCMAAAFTCGVMVGIEMERGEFVPVKPKRKRKSK